MNNWLDNEEIEAENSANGPPPESDLIDTRMIQRRITPHMDNTHTAGPFC